MRSKVINDGPKAPKPAAGCCAAALGDGGAGGVVGTTFGGTTVAGGGGAGMGGGIFTMFGSLTVTNSTLSGNIAEGGGSVTFAVSGQSVQASVDGNGNASVSLTLPLLTAISPQSISAAYSGANTSGSATMTVRWLLFNALLPSIDTFLADGTQLVQFSVFGIPLLFLVDAPSGQLVGFGMGAD